MYDQMVKELRGAVAQLEKEGHAVNVRAFIWIQGESDAETDTMAAGYFERLKRLIKDFRENVAKHPKLPVVLGVDEQHPWVKSRPVVVESHKRLAETDGCAVFTSMIGLPKADASHLTPAGLEAHGKRLFDAFIQLKGKPAEQAGGTNAVPAVARPKPVGE
jgi:hypothetical protein